jgi:ATP-dependent Clp protease protease subunit
MFRYEDEEEEDKKEDAKAPGPDASEKFLKTRTILLSGEVNKALAERVIRQLLLLEAESADPIKVMIDSPGGDVNAGYAIFDMIRFVNAPVYTIGMGLVASAGALILLAAPRERRIGLPNSQYLIHQPLSGMRGVATEIEIHAREMEKMRVKLNQLIADETGKPIAEVEKHTDRDYWLDAAEATQYGLLSRVVGKRADLGV